MKLNESVFTGKVTFLSKPNASGWHHGKIKLSDGTKWAISGNALAGISEGNTYDFVGKVGEFRGEAQIKVETVMPSVEANKSSITRHLMENFTGLGQKTTRDLINLWEESGMGLEDLRQTILFEPYKLETWAEESGLQRKIKLKVGKTKGHPDVEHVYRALALQHKVNDDNKVVVADAVLRKVARYLLGIHSEEPQETETPKKTVVEALEFFREDPFQPMFVVDGYGFLSADAVWTGMKKPKNHENRLGALGWHLLESSCEMEGHTYLSKEDYARSIYSHDSSLSVQNVFESMQKKNIPVILEDDRYYVNRLWSAENYVAEKCHEFLTPGSSILGASESEIEKDIEVIERKVGFKLDDEQRVALLGIATSKTQLHTITAMPGCGKTAIMEFLAQMVKNEGGKMIAFMAPTGKASKVLDKRVKKVAKEFEAVTIHSAISYGNDDADGEMLDADVIVVDEFSMVDVQLMKMLLKKMKPTAHIVCVGDQDQLPSVGPGSILRDLLRLPFDHHKLENVHRNSGNILKLVKSIKDGVYKKFAAEEGKENDVLVYGLPGVEKIPNLLDKYIEEVGKRVDGLKKVCLLTGLRRGDPLVPGWNITYLNKALQTRMNADGVHVAGSFIKLNDRIIIKKNQKFECVSPNGAKKVERLANGDTGELKDVFYNADKSKIESVVLELDDGRSLKLPGDVLHRMDLAYALTVHASQGSEYECAMVVMTNGYRGLFNRKLLYTAVSRAKEKLYLFGDGAVLNQIVAREADKRNSNLVEKIMVMKSVLELIPKTELELAGSQKKLRI